MGVWGFQVLKFSSWVIERGSGGSGGFIGLKEGVSSFEVFRF
jgi:hypothetical protein